jgi:hypothetical protein
MNRQLRRANEKSDKKKEREKQRRRKERIEARQSAKAKPSAAKASPSKASTSKANDKAKVSKPSRMPGRWAGPLAIATIFIVLLGAVLPQQQTPLTFVIDIAYYLLFGYFACLWLLRRGTQRVLFLSTLGGFLLGVVVIATKLYQPAFAWQPLVLVLVLAIPAAFLGALLGRALYRYGQA